VNVSVYTEKTYKGEQVHVCVASKGVYVGCICACTCKSGY
jgi:hypothetical protein